MRRVCIALGMAAVLASATWMVSSLWGEVEREEPSGRAPVETTPRPPGAEDAGLAALRQRFREMTPEQKTAVLRELLASIRQDVVQRQREAARKRFERADVDGDGKLSFEEAWQGGLFRVGRPDERGRIQAGGPRRAREELRRMAGPRGEPLLPGRPRPPAAEGRAPGFPTSELERELLKSWELLQELNVLSQDAGE